MPTESEDLRDLAGRIEEMSRNHNAFSMVHEIVSVMCDHIYCMARTIELRKATDDVGTQNATRTNT